jgi:hypothetical protein
VSIVVIAQQVEFEKLFVLGTDRTWAPTPDEYAIIGGLFTEYNEFCTHAKQSYRKAWLNKDTNHGIFDVEFDKVVGTNKYEVVASIILEFGEVNDRFNCHFYVNRYELTSGIWIWKESLAASSLRIGSGEQVKDVWNASAKKAKSASDANA